MDTLEHEKEIEEYLKSIELLKKQSKTTDLFSAEIRRLEERLEEVKARIYTTLTPWQRIQICRHRKRPHSIDYIENLCESFVELCGDRTFRDDQAIIAGLAKINGIKCMIIAQEKGRDTEDRMKRNFGSLHPEGFRKALRAMKLAEKFNLPVISLIDTQGAYPCLEAEQRGQGWAIAANLLEMSRLKTPIIVVIIGEGSSGGALGMGVGDAIGMLQHAYYSVISPEGCSSILWNDVSKKGVAAEMLKLNAENLLELQIIDEVIQEPLGGAHHAPQVVFDNVRQFVVKQLRLLKMIPIHLLTEQRYQKFRNMGAVRGEEIGEIESKKIDRLNFRGHR